MSQIKAMVENRISFMEDRFSNLEEMVKMLDLHNQTVASATKVSVRGNTHSGSRKDDHDAEILEGEEIRPPLEPIHMEELGIRYEERREYVVCERRGADFERREIEYDQRGANFEREELEEGLEMGMEERIRILGERKIMKESGGIEEI